MKREQQRYGISGILIVLLLIPCLVLAGDKPYERVVVFGDSLSDPGNAFFLSGISLKPPYSTLDELLIPDAPYARGGNHFSNGPTWIERLAKKLDVGGSAKPAFKGKNGKKLKMTNYAVGGARARDNGIDINLNTQLSAFLSDSQGVASMDALYVIALGGNDVRDAVAALSVDPTGQASNDILQDALIALSDSIIALHGAGATKLLIVNAPDLSLTPAIQRLDSLFPGTALGAAVVSLQFNLNLAALLDDLSLVFPALEIAQLNVFQMLHEIVDDPDAFGLNNVMDACVMPDLPPFACKKPKRYLFWDGIHPTRATHRIFAREAAEVLNLGEDEDRDSFEDQDGKEREMRGRK
ncbi:MAG: SGNH/GDSL hydrolase family protein [Candidatus Thiodiazotropha endolucinida]